MLFWLYTHWHYIKHVLWGHQHLTLFLPYWSDLIRISLIAFCTWITVNHFADQYLNYLLSASAHVKLMPYRKTQFNTSWIILIRKGTSFNRNSLKLVKVYKFDPFGWTYNIIIIIVYSYIIKLQCDFQIHKQFDKWRTGTDAAAGVPDCSSPAASHGDIAVGADVMRPHAVSGRHHRQTAGQRSGVVEEAGL